MVEALGDAKRGGSERQRPRHQGDGLLELDVVEARADLAADLEDVAEALGRDQRGPGDAALDDRVGGDGRAVGDVAEFGGVRVGGGQDPVGDVEEADARVGRRRGHLVDARRAGLLVDEDRVGERAADVDAEAVAHQRRARRARSSAVRASSIDRPSASIATPYSRSARSAVIRRWRTSCEHLRRVALERRAVAAAAGRLHADDVARRKLERVLRAQFARLAIRVEDVARLLPGSAAEQPVRAPLVAVGKDRERDRVLERVVASQPEAAAVPARPFGLLDQLVARDPHRVVDLGLLDRRVLGVLRDAPGRRPGRRSWRARRGRRRRSRGTRTARRRAGCGRRSRRGRSSPSSPPARARGSPARARRTASRPSGSRSPSRPRPGAGGSRGGSCRPAPRRGRGRRSRR